MKVTEEAEEFLKGTDILDGHTDTERAKRIVRGLLTEIERLQPKAGKWITVKHLPQNIEFKRCICCDYLCAGWDYETGMTYDYCPNCGAKMN